MPLETAEYFDTLQPDWPLGTDPENQGDDHIRMIKQVIQNTFPSLNGAVIGTPTEFNNVTTGLQFYAENADTGVGDHFSLTNPAVPGTQTALQVRSAVAQGEAVHSQSNFVVTWYDIMNALYPVGAVVMNSKNANPSTYLGFGTWVARQGSIYGAGAKADYEGMSVTLSAGNLAGNWRIANQKLVATKYNLAMNAVTAHAHDVPNVIWTGGTGNAAQGGTSNVPGKVGTAKTSDGGGHTPSGTVTIGTDTLSTGSPYQQPGYVFYVWERTA
jgi:hypothetical protein